ncbi:hypothetical protein E2C01_080277 [Portunus trituberculatus]|uniref:Uncharacterized protein n=1 Tax=Portunus trituberculatus TaxID=210409 RepID=A0A5B7IXZ3_PORTR|nr:hypothetical protein [Portunus trituberculatus]
MKAGKLLEAISSVSETSRISTPVIPASSTPADRPPTALIRPHWKACRGELERYCHQQAIPFSAQGKAGQPRKGRGKPGRICQHQDLRPSSSTAVIPNRMSFCRVNECTSE